MKKKYLNEIGSSASTLTNLRIQNLTFWIFACITIVAVIWMTYWQGRYVADPHHWGLMLSNVTDLLAGRKPYQEIFIQYGILTTLTHTAAYLLGNNLISIVVITGLCFGLGIVILGHLVYCLSKNIYHSIVVMVVCVLIHPIVIYPWSNYIAFPFMLLGLYGLIFNLQKNYLVILSGVALGMSALARENLFLPLLLVILVTLVIDFLNNKCISKKLKIYILSFSVTITLFIVYLLIYKLEKYWYISGILLPKFFASEVFPSVNSWQIFNPFINTLISGLIRLDPRWITIFLIIIANLAIIIKNIFRYSHNDSAYIKISLFSLFLCSSAIHLTEIFRLATGFIIGLISISYFAKKVRFIKYIVLILILFLLPTTINGNSGNYYLPSDIQIKESVNVESGYFKSQKWHPSVTNYYKNIDEDLKKIHLMQCGIKYHYNSTSDNFIKILSPFIQFQFLPMSDGPFEGHKFASRINALRQDIDYQKKISEHKDIILFKSINKDASLNEFVDEGFYIYKKYVIPNLLFVNPNSILLILIPKNCI